MSLEALAPDQRAVVQLVLQQDRSYEDLAVLLGISSDAVRERAHRGLERLAPGEAIEAEERAEVADYLLGQQSVSGREATRALLAASQPARSWALAVAGELAGISSSALPDVPAGDAPPRRPEAEPEPQEPVDEPIEPVGAEEPAVPVRARPRPGRPADAALSPVASDIGLSPAGDEDGGDGPRPRSSRLGGALLIGGLAILVAALVVWIVTKNDDSGSDSAATPTPTASASSGSPTPQPSAGTTGTPEFQPIGQLALTSEGDSGAKGQLVVFASADKEVAFTIQGTGMPASKSGEAYGVWLIGGDASHFLGFAPAVAEDGKFGTSGPRPGDAQKFARWLAVAKQIVVSRETQEGATEPGPLVLSGDLAKAQGGSAATPTP